MTLGQLRFVLGDQLSPTLSALRGADKDRDVILMVEAASEATYVRHHKKKIAFVLSAMRAFAQELRDAGWRIDYVPLDDPDNTQDLASELARAVARWRPAAVSATLAGEYRLVAQQRLWGENLNTPVHLLEDDRFICGIDEFNAWAADRRQLRMEFFYRAMRRKTGLLMDGDQPAGGRWNFDSENRKPARKGLAWPHPPRFAPSPETERVLSLVGERYSDHFGDLDPFWLAVTRRDAEAAASDFIANRLALFGDYQDAMITGEAFLAHSLLSSALNVGLLDPLTLCRQAETAYRSGSVTLNAAEGFIRQIIGWREFIRGVYWRHMPGYIRSNSLAATRTLPLFYWTGETDMTCLAEAIGQTRREAYAHHIQRLMVTGNFALLAGIDPAELHEWYLSVYIDAFEWVEAPNTIGMSQYADGGVVASKPYASSGAYIKRMSNYCQTCRYDSGARTGPDACPFNALYWRFVDRHRTRFAANPRMSQMVATLNAMAPELRQALLDQAEEFLSRIDLHGTDKTPC